MCHDSSKGADGDKPNRESGVSGSLEIETELSVWQFFVLKVVIFVALIIY